MCHVLLFSIPIFGLALFHFFPFETALPAYLVIVLASFVLFYKIFVALSAKVWTGREGMIGGEALVIEDLTPEGKVRFRDEIWTATANGRGFLKGRKVIIRQFHGLELVVGDLGDEVTGHQNARICI